MSEKVMPFVVTDRRKFTMEGEPRPEFQESKEQREREEALERERLAALPPAPPSVDAEESSARVLTDAEAHTPIPADAPVAAAPSAPEEVEAGYPDDMPPPPTAEQMEQSRLAYDATADRLETAIRAANPGMEHPPAMNFERLVQSVYMTAIMQLGGGTPDGQQPQVDLMGARQSIDMLTVVAEKSVNNLTSAQITLIDSALFELRMGFLEITQALARQAAARNPGGMPGGPGTPRPGFGPSIVR